MGIRGPIPGSRIRPETLALRRRVLREVMHFGGPVSHETVRARLGLTVEALDYATRGEWFKGAHGLLWVTEAGVNAYLGRGQ